jgi:PAS domain S-box-containing protein
MNDILNVLIVEDNPDDAELLVRLIKKAGIELNWERTDNSKDLRYALKKTTWDIVLSDFAMPQFNGFEALEIVRSMYPDLPFILISGTVGEDIAVLAIKSGAQDYIMKDRLVRLVPSIEKELREKKSRLEKRRIEEEVNKLSSVLKQSHECIIITDLNGTIEYVNQSFFKITGYEQEEVIGKNPKILSSGLTPKEIYSEMWKELLNGEIWEGEFQNRKKNGQLYWASVTVSPIRDKNAQVSHFVAVQQDITEKKAKDEKLLQALKEKGTLLKEIHHRVKNNLQIISSLLKMQAEKTKDTKTLGILKDSHNRIKSMALIHESLYSNDNFSSIDYEKYVINLVNELRSTFKANNVKFDIKIKDIFFDIQTAIPCGLIINELVTNSLKYAFRGGKNHTITVEISKNLSSNYVISVSDNGIGLPEDIDVENTKTMGYELVTLLSKQIDSIMTIDRVSGTKFNFELNAAIN